MGLREKHWCVNGIERKTRVCVNGIERKTLVCEWDWEKNMCVCEWDWEKIPCVWKGLREKHVCVNGIERKYLVCVPFQLIGLFLTHRLICFHSFDIFQAAKRKVYMLYHLEPDKSVTGGAWYSGQDFDSEFVAMLNDQCFKYLEERAAIAKESNLDPMSQRNGSFVSSTDVTSYIAKLNVSKVRSSCEA